MNRKINLILFPIIYFADVWIIGTIAAALQAPELMPYFQSHPVKAGWEIFLSYFGHDLYPAAASVVKTWGIINILFILSIGGIILIQKYGTYIKKNPEFKSNLLGSARWAYPYETWNVFKNKLNTPGLLFGTVETKPLILPADVRGNLNVAVLGPPGSGKSRAYVRNNLFQAVASGWSVIVTDPKGELTRDFRTFFEEQGYDVKIFNLVDMLHSHRWNPLSQVETDMDAQLLTEVVIANTQAPGRKSGDPFWDRAETNLLKALVLYVINELPPEERNLGRLYELLASGDSKYLDMLFSPLSQSHPAKMPYNIYVETSPQVRSGVIIGLGTRLQVFQNRLVKSLTDFTDINLESPGYRKSAYFCIISDMDRTFNFLASLFFSFLFISLTRYADRNEGKLPVFVNFLLDEFCNIGHIPDFTKKISTMRSRGIACSVIFQSITQLQSHYPEKEWETIMADCDSWLTLGVKDVTSAKYISDHLGEGTIEAITKTRPVFGIFDFGQKRIDSVKRKLMNPDELTRMPSDEAILSPAWGLNPIKITKMDFSRHPMAKKLNPTSVQSFNPPWAEAFKASSNDRNAEPTITAQPEEPGIYSQGGEADSFWG
jgi:type IV secretion system protein VirD4